MIPVWQAKDTRNPLAYNSYTINQEIGGDPKNIVEVWRIQFQTPIQTIVEPWEQNDGLKVYPAYKRGKRLVVAGVVRATSRGTLYDRVEELAAAYDPAQVSRDNPSTNGVLPLDFNVPTGDTTNFPTGLMACRYYVRAEQAIEPPSSPFRDLEVPFIIPLLAPDPRRYLQTEEDESIGAQTDIDNGIATFYSWPTLTIEMAGAGSATFSITDGDKSLTLDLSGRANGEVVTVDMENRRIEVDGALDMTLYVSGNYFALSPGTTTFVTTNTTNATVSLQWRPAFSF